MRVLAPFDDDVRRSALTHRGARPQARPRPDWLVPLGPTIGWASNGAVSNISHTPYAVSSCAASCAPAASTSSTCTSPSRPWSAGTR